MRTFHESDIRRRVKVLAFGLAAWSLVVAARLVQLQVFGHARAKAAVLDQARNRVTVEPRRGDILDRNGQILACSLPAPSVVVRNVEGETPAQEQAKVRRLQQELGLSPKEAAYVLGRLKEDRGYTYVKKRVPEADAARVMALRLAGLDLEAGTRRYYPLGSLASHVIGGMNPASGDMNGVELRYNAVLKGEEGERVDYRVRGGRGYETRIIKPPVPGRDIVLTIDATIQYIVEKELARTVAGHEASWGAIVVMDPASGEILALASWPSYDVNEFPGPKEAWRNHAVQAVYEPGSTFKIVTAAAARERNRVSYTEVFDCSAGSIRVAGTTISDHRRCGLLPFPRVIQESSNVGTVLFAQRLAIPEYFETIKAFGFGTKTGIDLPGEVAGRVRRPEEWNKRVSLPHVAIGYEVTVNALQILRAMNAFAAGGLLVRPHVVKDGPAAGGGRSGEDGDGPARAVSERIAAELVERVFTGVIDDGTGSRGRLDGYGAAGKTGTSQKYDDALKSYTKTYTASFVGFTPLKEPRLSMVVVLDGPKNGYYGGETCAPVFKDIARQVLRYLRVPPERPLPPRILTAGLKKGGRP